MSRLKYLFVSRQYKWNGFTELSVVAGRVSATSSTHATSTLPRRPPASIVSRTKTLVHCQQRIHCQNHACNGQQNCQHQLHIGTWWPNLCTTLPNIHYCYFVCSESSAINISQRNIWSLSERQIEYGLTPCSTHSRSNQKWYSQPITWLVQKYTLPNQSFGRY